MTILNDNLRKRSNNQDASVLDLSSQGIMSIPEELTKFEWVEKLDISSNTFIKDGTLISSLINLRTLIIKQTKINNLNFIQHLTRLEHLDITSCPITDISPISQLSYLSVLKCEKSNISNLAPLINLKRLVHLDIDSTDVSSLEDLSKLDRLEYLLFSHTKITDITPLKGLKKLKRVNFEGTSIVDLSPIQELSNLEYICLDSTEVTDLSALSLLTKLNRIELDNTKVKDLKPLKDLKNLKDVFCMHTEVTDLSPLLNALKKKGIIRYDAHNITIPPREITKQGEEAIISYLEDLEWSNFKPSIVRLSEVKCLIIGEGGVGKTSLTLKLENSATPLPNEEDTTRGLEIHTLRMSLDNAEEIKLNIWDFGGQEIYYATHQYFLTRRSIYILVDDTRKSDINVIDPVFNYWLQVVELYSESSPLIIVQNKKGDRSKEIDIVGIRAKFPFVKEVTHVNLATGSGLPELINTIKKHVTEISHVGNLQPFAWLQVRRTLERIRRDRRRLIQFDEFLSICIEHKVHNESVLILSSYLHDLGVILHFQNHPLLKNIIILDNEWATKPVYKLLDSESIRNRKGFFYRSDLIRVWQDITHKDRHEELLALMEKFELCYKILDTRQEIWIAPQLTSIAAPPDFVWDYINNLQIVYKYEFMPKGLLTQLIVRLHSHVRDTSLVWKNGVVFEKDEAKAFVSEAWGQGSIVISASGILSKELLNVISDDLDRMHDRISGIKVKKLIPCNCKKCYNSQNPHFFDYNDLIKRIKANVNRIECNVSFRRVSISNLLGIIFSPQKYLNSTIKELLEEGKTDKALSLLAKITDDAIILSNKLSTIEKSHRIGSIKFEEYLNIKTKITNSALWLLNEHTKND